MSRPRFGVEEYTVGWVCALPVELAAATEMLDEEHGEPVPPQDATDTNVYSLGRIGQHKVVIACLPAGQMGTSSAAAVAAQMMSKFVCVKIGLMVGIGGGVPGTEADIRLGDVVISQPHMQNGGVVQYDFGKAGANGEFTRTGRLNAPPVMLLNALSKLRSNYLIQKSNVSEHLSAIATHLPQFASPAAGSDILFLAAYNHTIGLTCEECSADQTIERILRGSKEVVVHYGTIASGNQVIKDGLTRDRLSLELGGVLCFEMEAAGLMNSFPCLVIRGICDYADSHKNKEWQPYAAATAAACTKELLSIIPATEVAKTSLKSDDQKDYQYCLDVLFLTNSYDDKAKLISTKSRRVEGTCEWIKNDIAFRSWLESGSRLLWVSGGPGKGKTMLSIFITDELAEDVKSLEDTKIIFYFCDHQDEKRNTAIAILRGLLLQILKERPMLFESIRSEFKTKKKALYTISSLESLWRAFETLLRDPGFGTWYCVIDGLDECDQSSLQILITKLSDFFTAYGSKPTAGEFRLIVVSRDLAGPLTKNLTRFPRLRLDPDSDDQVNNDIKTFISVKVNELSGIEGFNGRIRADIEKTLLERAEGTFLWVGFVTNELLQKETCTEILETLECLPKGLSGIYSRMLLQINESRRNTAASILRWVVMALRPLTLAELACAINPAPIRNLSSDQVIQDCIRSCGAFFKIVEDCVSLIHQSARDYLIRGEPDNNPILETFRIKQEEANFELARTCLSYIQNEAASNALANYRHTLHFQKFPLLNYAALQWPEHARRAADLGEDLFDLSSSFCQKGSLIFPNWWIWYCETRYMFRTIPTNCPLLHMASCLGILPLARKLLEKKGLKQRLRNPVNEKDVYGNTPLFYAVKFCHGEVVQQLLSSKANVNAKNDDGPTALHPAVRIGDKAIVQQLLNSKANVNAKDKYGSTILHLAVRDRNEEIVQLLVESKADVNAKKNDGSTALHFAAQWGNWAAVQLLLESKADINAKNNDGSTVLHIAIEWWNEAAVQLLLESKADINAKNNDGSTALHFAAQWGNWAAVQLLLESKADINAKNNDGLTALHIAIEWWNEAAVQLLLESKADVNAKDNDGSTALHGAAKWGDGAVVQQLLDNKADFTIRNDKGQTAQDLAAMRGREAIIRQLESARTHP